MFERILAVLARILIWAAAICLVAMALHVTADVIMKYVFNKPIPGTAEVVAYYYMLAVVFLPLPFVETRNSAISVDLFYNMFSTPLRRGCMLLAYAGQTAFFGVLGYQSFSDALKSHRINEFIDGQIQVYVWPPAFFLPAGLWLATAISVVRILQILFRSDWEQITTLSPEIDGDRPVKEFG